MGFWNSLKDFLFEDEIVDFTDEVSDGETVQGTDKPLHGKVQVAFGNLAMHKTLWLIYWLHILQTLNGKLISKVNL